jgi:DNA-binding transcriptional LysR family regulator
MRRSNGSIAPWSFVDGNKTVEAIVSGPTTGQLVRVLEQFAPMKPGVFLYYPGHRQLTPKLRAFIDHAKRRSNTADKT